MTKTWWLRTVDDFNVSPSSASRYISEFCAALTYAQNHWDVKPDWESFRAARGVLKADKKISKGRPRTRRVHPGEIEAIKAASHAVAIPLSDIIDFALALGFRQGEISRITWADLDDGHITGRPMIWVRDRKDPKEKMGNDQHIPLIDLPLYPELNPLAILKRQARRIGEPRIFPWQAQSIARAWQVAAARAGVKGLHFHDLRHEAISRLFEQGYSIPEVALVSGHKNWTNLKRYTNLQPTSLHDGPLMYRKDKAPPKLRVVA
jgi:integrase